MPGWITIVKNGLGVGMWRRQLKPEKVIIEIKLVAKLQPAYKKLLLEPAESYGRFLGLAVEVVRSV